MDGPARALRRLRAEHKQLMEDPPEGIYAGPRNDENYFIWEAIITGPKNTPFENGMYFCTLEFPDDYPLSPPKMTFTTNLYHPNVYTDGRVCISILHAPGDDPTGYETKAERWSPVQSVEKILLSVMLMLAEPNDESPANIEAAKLWREDREEFNRRARNSAMQSLGIEHGDI
ncbi:hypothetical protein GJ496_003750 [Pomphorhynchus laevis]|nr:hypothetical protein GJ496_003750 [Pomphorhynchus laevis]